MTSIRRERGYLYHDFEPGRVFDHHWGRTFTEHDTVWYSSFTMQYNPLYFSRPYAKQLGYQDIPVNPLFVFTTALGLSVEDLSEAGGPFLGVDDLKFHRAVYRGDTVRARSTVISRRTSASRPGWGIVEWHTICVDQEGRAVLEFSRRNLARMRPTLSTSEE